MVTRKETKKTKSKINPTPHLGGRPTKYHKQICSMMVDFFTVKHTKEIVTEAIGKEGAVIMKTRERDFRLLERFIDYLAEWHGEKGLGFICTSTMVEEFLSSLEKKEEVGDWKDITLGEVYENKEKHRKLLMNNPELLKELGLVEKEEPTQEFTTGQKDLQAEWFEVKYLIDRMIEHRYGKEEINRPVIIGDDGYNSLMDRLKVRQSKLEKLLEWK